jgi:hypothetical protein
MDLDFIEKKISIDLLASWQFIIIILLLFTGFLFASDSTIEKAIPNVIFRFGLYALILLIVFTVWKYFHDDLPKKQKDCIGIVLSIEPEDDQGKSRLETEFVPVFKELIKENDLQRSFRVIKTEKYQAKKINSILESIKEQKEQDEKSSDTHEKWAQIHNVIQGDFYLWGKLYQREGNKHVLDFDVFVDEDFSPNLKKELENDYSAFGIKRKFIEITNETEGFKIEAKFYYIVAKYVISLTALYNGNFEISHQLHKSLEHDFSVSENFQSKNHLIKRLNQQLSLEHFIFSRRFFSEGKIPEAEKELGLAQQYDSTSASVYLFEAVIEFLVRRKVETALRLIHKARDYSPADDGTWKYSEAFLYLYKGNHRQALEMYKNIFSYTYEGETIIVKQVIGFFELMLKIEPKFIESYLILGLIKGKKQELEDEALYLINTFLDKAGKTPKYNLLRIEASKYKKDLEDAKLLVNNLDRNLAISN